MNDLSQDRTQSPRERHEERLKEQHRQRDEMEKARAERNAEAQQTGGEESQLTNVQQMVRDGYENVEQPGMHPGNMPRRRLEGDGRDHKGNHDLEDITGNPGHLNCNPNAPAFSINRASAMLTEGNGPESINEPPDVKQAMPPDFLPSINEPPGSTALPGTEEDPSKPFDQESWQRRQDERQQRQLAYQQDDQQSDQQNQQDQQQRDQEGWDQRDEGYQQGR